MDNALTDGVTVAFILLYCFPVNDVEGSGGSSSMTGGSSKSDEQDDSAYIDGKTVTLKTNK